MAVVGPRGEGEGTRGKDWARRARIRSAGKDEECITPVGS